MTVKFQNITHWRFSQKKKNKHEKEKELGKKLVTMLVSVGLFAVLITVFNLMALQAIREKNNVLIEQFEQYEEAVENNDTAVLKQQRRSGRSHQT